MQGADTKNQAKSHSDEDSINFRPSPNFKHMKKYLKSKFEEAMANTNSSEGTSESSFGHDEREKVNSSTAKPVVQPPLPPNPPPPDSPIINLKQEIEDDEYQCSTTENHLDFNQPEQIMTETIKTDHSESSDKAQVTMCRNFARGTCKKGASCIFAHEIILSQLPGVYTFCRNFQNSVCTFPKCKFIHATVFEKEYYYRTGYLPPHTQAHLKEPTVLAPPPPPPPPEELPPEVPQVYSNALPPPVQQCIAPVAVLNAAVPTLDRNDPFRTEQTSSTSPKREWSEANEFSSSPRDLDSCESLAKKCKNCENNEFRLQFNKSKTEKMLRTNEEIDQKIASLNKRNAKLSIVLGTLLRPSKNSCGTKALSLSTEKEKNLLTNNVHFTTLLAKMLLKNSDSVVPPDAS